MNVSSRKGFLNSTISVDSLIQNRGSLSGCQPLDKELQATNDCRGGTKKITFNYLVLLKESIVMSQM